VGQVAVAALVIDRQAHAGLLLSVQRKGRLVRMAAMACVDAVDRRTPISLQPEQRADAIHDSQDTNSPAGETDGADV
jgi:predicted transposase YbfD/YdcC